jgi:hypothetical protein
MKLKEQVCTEDQGKRIKELGINKEPLFVWNYLEGFKTKLMPFQKEKDWFGKIFETAGYDDDVFYPAYTASELMEMLPYGIYENDRLLYLSICKVEGNKYTVEYMNDRDNEYIYIPFDPIVNKNLTIAIADLMIWLIENKRIKHEK